MAVVAMQKRRYIYSLRSYIIFGAILITLTAYFGFQQLSNYFAAKDALALEQNSLPNLQGQVAQIKGEYATIKNQYDQRIATISDALQYVLPADEVYTSLVRLFDIFALPNNTQISPFFVSDVKFGTSRAEPNADYSVLPVNMTINTSKSNFMKFLQFIENSGMLESKTRLMDIRTISINFSSNETGNSVSNDPVLNVSLALNAYFQKAKPNNQNTNS